jgi:DNA-binding IclR family transcriptional regulator
MVFHFPKRWSTIRNAMNPTPDARLVGSDRVLAVLKELADHCDGIGLDDLSRAVSSPKPTVHRALASLRRAGLADQDARGHYVLGDEFLRMAFTHHESRPDHLRIQPVLDQLAAHFGETAHFAVLDGHSIVYRAKVDPPKGAVRLTSTVGGRNPAHSTAVGKLLLSYDLRTLADVRRWIGQSGLERRTDQTLWAAEDLLEEFETIRRDGYAVDDQENETGVNCLAVPVFLTSTTVPSGGVSVSALTYRTPLSVLVAALDDIRRMTPSAAARQTTR